VIYHPVSVIKFCRPVYRRYPIFKTLVMSGGDVGGCLWLRWSWGGRCGRPVKEAEVVIMGEVVVGVGDGS